MKHSRSFSPQASDVKSVSIAKKYRERHCSYKQASSGGSFVVDFVITLQPNDSDTVELYAAGDGDTQMTVAAIAAGIERLIAYWKKREVSLRGIDILVENAVVHPVDFNPLRYESETTGLIKRILFTHGKWTLAGRIETNAHPQAYPAIHITNLFEELKVRKMFPLPNTLQRVLKFPERTYVRQTFDFPEWNESVTIEWITELYTTRHLNGISLYAGNDPVSIQLFLIAEDVVKKLVKEVSDQGFDLMSFHIGIREVTRESPYFSAYGMFQEELYWYMKNLLLTDNDLPEL